MEKNKLDSIMGFLLGSIILVPFKIKPILIVLFLCYALFFFVKTKKRFSIKSIKRVGFMSLLYVPLIISVFYSYNVERGITYLIRFLPLLCIPLSFAFMKIESKKTIIDTFVPVFVITNALYIFIMLLYILHLGYLRSENDLYYYYSFITYEFYHIGDHPIYLSVQFVLALFLLFNSKFFDKVQKTILFAVLFFGLFFLARKGVILSFIILLPLYLINIIKSKPVMISSISIVIIAFFAFLFVPEIKNRYAELWNKESYIKNEITSTGIRLVLWENSLELIKESPIFGYGIGDIQDLLSQQMKSNGFLVLAERKSNCHNQYLQFLMSIGLIGLALFIISIFYYFIQFKNENNILGATVLIFFLLLFMTESFLDRQNGIILFSIFMSILFFKKNNE
jgi:O-antigen ligase